MGYEALRFNTTGSSNVAVGQSALENNTTGSFNTALGSYNALYGNTTGSDNFAVGYYALGDNTTGSYNIGLGYQSAETLTTGSYNIALGSNVGFASTTGSQQLNVGDVLYGTGMYNGGSVSATPVSGAKIGIGTSSPNSILEVSASNNGTTLATFGDPTISITNRSTANNSFSTLAFRSQDLTNGSASSTAQILGIATSHTANQISGALAFLTQNAGQLAEVGRFTTAGNLGIGTTTPWARLSVGTSSLGAAVPEFDVGSSTRSDLVVTQSGNVGIGTISPATKFSISGNDYITGGEGVGLLNTTAGTLQTSGNATIGGCVNYNGGTSGTCLSDERVKTDINSFTDGLSEIVGLNPVTYEYNGLAGTPNDGDLRTGLIAQQVQQVAPDLVSTTSALLNPSDTAPTQLLEVNYGALTFALINAVKEIASIPIGLKRISSPGSAMHQTELPICMRRSSTDNNCASPTAPARRPASISSNLP